MVRIITVPIFFFFRFVCTKHAYKKKKNTRFHLAVPVGACETMQKVEKKEDERNEIKGIIANSKHNENKRMSNMCVPVCEVAFFSVHNHFFLSLLSLSLSLTHFLQVQLQVYTGGL